MNRQGECDKVAIKRIIDCLQSIIPVTACAALMEEHCMCSSLHERASVCKQLSNNRIKNIARSSLRFTTLQLYKFTIYSKFTICNLQFTVTRGVL